MMQKAKMSAAEGQVITTITGSTMRSSRNDASFDLRYTGINSVFQRKIFQCHGFWNIQKGLLICLLFGRKQ